MFPIIREMIAPGTMIHHDDWRPYRTIPQIAVNPPYTHQTVVHTYNFVDPTTGAHTQAIESAWNRMKIKIKNMLGCKRSVLDSYLDEFMWLQRFGRGTGMETMNTLLTHMAQWFPPN